MMEAHKITIYDKRISVTDKSIFRVEMRGDNKKPYETMYSHKDVHKAMLFFVNTIAGKGQIIRLIKDGDEYVLLNKKKAIA